MITGAFQLLMQVMNMSYAPHIKLVSRPLPLVHPLSMALNLHLSRKKKADLEYPQVHTSRLFHGQVYMPLANILLMIGTVIVTAAYSNVGVERAPILWISVLTQHRPPG
jgi:KUP system potassium uptake protein